MLPRSGNFLRSKYKLSQFHFIGNEHKSQGGRKELLYATRKNRTGEAKA